MGQLELGHWTAFYPRISSEDKALEAGYFKTTGINRQTGEQRKSFGRFHVLLRKENGIWKNVKNADTGERASEENFNKANPYNCFQITAEINSCFDKIPELYNKR